MEMGRLTRDGTAEPNSRDQIHRRERDREKNIFPVQLTTSRIGNLTRLILALAICDDHTYIPANNIICSSFLIYNDIIYVKCGIIICLRVTLR